jgi:hypothetical protein
MEGVAGSLAKRCTAAIMVERSHGVVCNGYASRFARKSIINTIEIAYKSDIVWRALVASRKTPRFQRCAHGIYGKNKKPDPISLKKKKKKNHELLKFANKERVGDTCGWFFMNRQDHRGQSTTVCR